MFNVPLHVHVVLSGTALHLIPTSVASIAIDHMASRLLGQTSIFGVVFFVSKSLSGIER